MCQGSKIWLQVTSFPFFGTKQQGIRNDWSSSYSTNTPGVLLTNKGLSEYFGSMPWRNITLHQCCIVTGDSFPNTLNCIVQSLHSECSDVGVMTHLNTLRHCQLYFPVYQNEHWPETTMLSDFRIVCVWCNNWFSSSTTCTQTPFWQTHLFYLSFCWRKVLIQSQALKEDLESLIHLAHFMKHHSISKYSL